MCVKYVYALVKVIRQLLVAGEFGAISSLTGWVK
jgi:hypothetical protein